MRRSVPYTRRRDGLTLLTVPTMEFPCLMGETPINPSYLEFFKL